MLFYVFNLLLQNYIFTFDTIKTTDCKSSSSSKEQDCFTATRRGDFKTLLGVFSFLFLIREGN